MRRRLAGGDIPVVAGVAGSGHDRRVRRLMTGERPGIGAVAGIARLRSRNMRRRHADGRVAPVGAVAGSAGGRGSLKCSLQMAALARNVPVPSGEREHCPRVVKFFRRTPVLRLSSRGEKHQRRGETQQRYPDLQYRADQGLRPADPICSRQCKLPVLVLIALQQPCNAEPDILF